MAQVVIGSDHPALPGHFPGHPVVPAAVILAHVVDAARQACPEARITGIRKAKFQQRLMPEEVLRIDLDAPGRDSLKFVCHTDDAVVVQGRLTLEPKAEASNS
jgi:3-hydroxymyristoyl/3-hydroxydecanoyl-(acyl carrier protein) dehydratase